jgi:diguanylate cyclase (GGDEF)-like protein
VHKRLAQQIEHARAPSGEVDIDALAAGIAQTYRESGRQLGQARKRLRQQASLFATALDAMADGFSMFDARGRLIVCNKQFLEIYRLPPQCARRGTSFRHILKCRVAANTHEGDNPEEYIRTRLALIGGEHSIKSDVRLNTGQVIAVTHEPMEDGGWVSTHCDVTELHSAESELTHLAYHDPLTGVPNRNYLHQRLGEAFEQIGRTDGFAVLCLDLDGFKLINDTLGHSAGDRLLIEVARRLRSAIGPEDVLGRMGGDEFALVTPGGTADEAKALAGRLRDAVRPPVELDGHLVSVALSVGTALAPSDGDTPDELLKRADLALYAAKREGRGNIRAFDPAMDRAVRDKRRLEADLRLALENGEFELHYQPIVNLSSQRFAGFEALLRWQHPVRGTVMPGEFIGLAEELGLIVPIGEWVVREALAEATRWPAELRVAINISPAQFGRGNIVTTITNALAATQIAHERVELEITESVLMSNTEANIETLQRLHMLGVRIALDDFGTGYSALSYLLSFPFDKIKIDGTFVRALSNAGAAHTIVRSVADIGDRLGLITTAEGVETAEQLRNVNALGYTEAQGHVIAPPMSAATLRRLLDGAVDTTPEAPFARAG